MFFRTVKDTINFLATGNLYEKMTILLLQTFCTSCWNVSKLTVSYTYRLLKIGYDKRFLVNSFLKKKSLKKQKEKGINIYC